MSSKNIPNRGAKALRLQLFPALLVLVMGVLVAYLVPGVEAATTEQIYLEEPTLEIYLESYLQEPEPEVDDFMSKVDVEEELLLEEPILTKDPIYTTDPYDTTTTTMLEIPEEEPSVRLLRISFADYADGISSLAGPDRDSARLISNKVLSQSVMVPISNRASDWTWQWGQFIDHDVDLTEPDFEHPEHADIPVPTGDPFFDPEGEGNQFIEFIRSVYDPLTGTSTFNPREQVNNITAAIDASNVYGSDAHRAGILRTNDGTGRLEVSPGDFLPYNETGEPNAGGPGSNLFLAGDIRANEQIALTATHTLFVREHNFWAQRLRNSRPSMTGDDIYEAARSVVMAELQIITYQEFLPTILGPGAIPDYLGYNPNVDLNIATEFSTSAYRLGHTMLSPMILRLNANGFPIPEGNLALRDAFFVPTELTSVGLEPYMKGLASQVMQRIDSKIVDDVRNFLFAVDEVGGLDLGALNIQRGRDHGLPDYNSVRIAYGLAPKASFADISSDPNVQAALADAYTNVNDMDVWIGALAEDHLPGTQVGELLYVSLVDQFTRLRDGDPDWYANRLNSGAARSLENQTLAKVIARNTTLLRSDLQHNVFIVP